ncbi:MAG: diaminopimelate decarboxylase [Pseudomonadota bacterium]
MNTTDRRGGRLYVEGVSLEQIAADFGTPTFVYSRAAITEAFLRFSSAFSTHEHQVCYAVKANSNLGVLGLLAQLGSGFDIVSGGELERVLRAGGDPKKTVFSGVGKQDWEIAAALDAGIACFNVESASELVRINTISSERGQIAPVSIRVNPDVDAKTHPYISTGLKENKFGVSITEAGRLYRYMRELANVRATGIDCHIGSQIVSLGPFEDAVRRIVALVDELASEGIEFDHIDLGGGIGVRYKDEVALDIEDYAKATLTALGNRRPALWFEPGRYMVANAGWLLTRVITLKENEGKHFAVVDAGMNDLIRPSLYGAYQGIEPVVARGGTATSYDVVGPICETGDFLGKSRLLDVREGDLLSVMSAGAYGFVMSSNYNTRGRAAEVMVDGDAAVCVRRRETIDDILALESTLDT